MYSRMREEVGEGSETRHYSAVCEFGVGCEIIGSGAPRGFAGKLMVLNVLGIS